MQKFYANEKFNFPNGAVGWRNSGPLDCLGPYAKVQQCPIAGLPDVRLTCYATGYADTYFSVPACTRYPGKYIGGYFALDDGEIEFRPMDRFKALLTPKPLSKAQRLEIAAELIKDILPHGSGIDSDWQIDVKSSGNVTASNAYHCMNEVGYYDGFADFTVTFYDGKPLSDFRLTFNGKTAAYKNERYMLRDYLEDTIYNALKLVKEKKTLTQLCETEATA